MVLRDDDFSLEQGPLEEPGLDVYAGSALRSLADRLPHPLRRYRQIRENVAGFLGELSALTGDEHVISHVPVDPSASVEKDQ